MRRLALGLAFIVTAGLSYSYWLASQPEKGLTRPIKAHASPFTQHDLTVNGLRLRYIDEGAGIPLVLVPGLSSRLEEYDGLTALLRHQYRVLVLDFPGSGYSEKPNREYSVEYYVETLIAFLDALNIRECYVAGGSLGGNVALRAGHRSPKRFIRLAAWGVGSAWNPRPAASWAARTFGGRALFWPTLQIQSTYWYRPGFPQTRRLLDQTWTYLHEVVSPGFIRMYWNLVSDQMGNSIFLLAPKIRQPVLLIWGEDDHWGDMGWGMSHLQTLLPHAELLKWPATGHAVAVERPTETAAALDEFFSRPTTEITTP